MRNTIMEILEINQAQQNMISQLDETIKLLQHQLNSAIAMAFAAQNIVGIEVIEVQPGKIIYKKKTNNLMETPPVVDSEPMLETT